MAQAQNTSNDAVSGLQPLSYLNQNQPAGVLSTRASRAPTTADRRFKLGTLWIDTGNNQVYSITNVTNNLAIWTLLGPGASDVDTLTGDTGGPLSPSGGNINILGGANVTVAGSGSTLTITTDADGFPVTPFVVGPVGDGGYQTIQTALDAANAAGGGNVVLQPATYTEDLTLYDAVNIIGLAFTGTIITGTHTPPASGALQIHNCTLTDATAILSSAVAGTANIDLSYCIMTVTNGYVFNLANWTGDLTLSQCSANGTNDGVVNNTGGSTVSVHASYLGAGTGQTFTYAGGTLLVASCEIACPMTIGTGATAILELGSRFLGNITTTNNAIVSILNSTITTGANAAISHGSSGTLLLSDLIITSSNDPAIAGAGAGVVTLVNNSFISNNNLSASLTFASGQVRGSGQVSRFVVGTTPDAPYQTVQDALDAANAAGGGTVYVKAGTFTEDLTLYDGVDLIGSIGASDTETCTIDGTHTPPTSGTMTIRNIFLTDASAIISSAAAGTADLYLIDVAIGITDGFVFDLPNWTGPGRLVGANIRHNNSTSDGWVNNTGGAIVQLINAEVGAGIGRIMVTSGPLQICRSIIDCEVNFQSGTSAAVIEFTLFSRELIFSGTSTGFIKNCIFDGGTDPAIIMGSMNDWRILNSTITSSNDPAIDGAGAGTLTLENNSFLENSNVDAALTIARGATINGDVKAINLIAETIGGGIFIQEGSNAKLGRATLVAGTMTVLNTAVDVNTRIFLTSQADGGTPGFLRISARVAGVSFTITSSSATDTSMVTWMQVEPIA